MKTIGLKDRMLKACETQDLGELYESQVDENLYNEKCDYDLDSRGLFFDLYENKFYLCNYVTPHSGWKDAHLNQNPCEFISWVHACTAISDSLENLIEEYFHFE